jgi:hypothetical protein
VRGAPNQSFRVFPCVITHRWFQKSALHFTTVGAHHFDLPRHRSKFPIHHKKDTTAMASHNPVVIALDLEHLKLGYSS